MLLPYRRKIALPQTYLRYYGYDFERRWRERLNMAPRWPARNVCQLFVKVTHRFPAPNRYGWELRAATGLPVEESRVEYASWEEASHAGKLALSQFSHVR